MTTEQDWLDACKTPSGCGLLTCPRCRAKNNKRLRAWQDRVMDQCFEKAFTELSGDEP